MNDTSRNYRSIRQHSNHNVRTGPYLGPFNKTIKSNPYRNINARGQIPLVLLSSGETPPRMGPQSRRPRSKAAEPQSRRARTNHIKIYIREARPQSRRPSHNDQASGAAEPRTKPQGSRTANLGPRTAHQTTG